MTEQADSPPEIDLSGVFEALRDELVHLWDDLADDYRMSRANPPEQSIGCEGPHRPDTGDHEARWPMPAGEYPNVVPADRRLRARARRDRHHCDSSRRDTAARPGVRSGVAAAFVTGSPHVARLPRNAHHGHPRPHSRRPPSKQPHEGATMGQPQPPYQPPRRAVTKKRGLSAGAHGRHLLLTICTCGLWLPVWGCWWLYRLIVRRKQVTRYR